MSVWTWTEYRAAWVEPRPIPVQLLLPKRTDVRLQVALLDCRQHLGVVHGATRTVWLRRRRSISRAFWYTSFQYSRRCLSEQNLCFRLFAACGLALNGPPQNSQRPSVSSPIALSLQQTFTFRQGFI